MVRHLPPFAAVRAFEAAARHLSFKAGAKEIDVTPAAISHQVHALEEYLGAKLFLRKANRVELTPTGRGYLDELSTLLDQLDDSTRRASRRGPEGPLSLLCTPGFAARWLTPRLSRCPLVDRIEVSVSTGAPSTDFARNEADVAIAWCEPEVSGAVVEPLMESSRYPVCSPELRARTRINRPVDLLDQRLIHDEVMDAWDKWFEIAGLPLPDLPRGPRLAHCELSLTAAEQGQGITLCYDAMARGALRAGRLVRLFDVEVPPITIYSLAYPAGRSRDPRIRAFRNWIFAEVAAEGTVAPYNSLALGLPVGA